MSPRRSRPCSSTCCSRRTTGRPSRLSSTSTPRTTRCTAIRKAASSTATMIATARPRLSENPKMGAMDDAEIIGDSVAEPLPLSGHGMPEELDDLPAELGEGLVVPVVGDVFVHQGPQPFDGIEMGTVGRKEAQNDL